MAYTTNLHAAPSWLMTDPTLASGQGASMTLTPTLPSFLFPPSLSSGLPRAHVTREVAVKTAKTSMPGR